MVRKGHLLGVVYAAYNQSPYLHMVPIETVFKNIRDFLQTSDIRVANEADLRATPQPEERHQPQPGLINVSSGLQSGLEMPSISMGLAGLPPAQLPPTASVLRRAQKKLLVCCDGSWLGRETRTMGTPRSNIRMLADMVGDLSWAEPDAAVNPAMVHPIQSQKPNVIAGYQLGGASQEYFFDFAWDSTINERLGAECIAVYRFIVEHFTDDHTVWLIGHSRGAYVARSVAGMINNCGIMRRQQGVLDSEQIDMLCEEIYQIYRSDLPSDSPNSAEMRGFRANADRVWQVKQPVRFMGLIDSVGPLGLPRVPGIFEPASSEFFDRKVSSAVKHVYHAVALHERLTALPPCLIEVPDQKSSMTHVNQTWLPGTHHDLGRTTFRFAPQHPYNWIAGTLGMMPDLFMKSVTPNEVLSDCALKWLLEGVRDVGSDSASHPIPYIDDRIAQINSRIVVPAQLSKGSGDIYGSQSAMTSGSRSRVTGAVQAAFITVTRLFSFSLSMEPAYLRSLDRIVAVTRSVKDRRIPRAASDVHPYLLGRNFKSALGSSFEDIAAIGSRNEWQEPRYRSRTFQSFQLWNEVFSPKDRWSDWL